MSRILGIVNHDNRRPPDVELTSLVGQLCPRREWMVQAAGVGPAAFAWTGRHGGGLAADAEIVVAIDGWIHNRRELGEHGTVHDAALLLDLYRERGAAGAARAINGEFAAAIYDQRSRRLSLIRDRAGVKPLYWVDGSDSVVFASRPRPLIGVTGVDARPDPQFVARFGASHYRTIDAVPAGSPYTGVRQVEARHLVEISNGIAVKTAYWTLHDHGDLDASEGELAERYCELLFDAVNLRLASSVGRTGFTLSGGMDSSSVLASAVNLTAERQHAFSSVYEDETYDESEDIKSMLESKVAEWHAVAIGTPDVLALVERMIDAHDEPVATATWLSHFVLCERAAGEGFSSLFGGLGGDELNAGEYEYFFFFFADLLTQGRRADFAREVSCWVKNHDHPIYRKSTAVAEETLGRVVDRTVPGVCVPDRRRIMRYAAALNPEFFDLEAFAPVMEGPFSSYLKNRCYQDIYFETAPCCLRALDRQTTAAGLADFVPFFDVRLIELMFQVPGTMKIRNGVTKHLLRLATLGVLPEETRTRVKKTGWNAPAHRWFTASGRDAFLDLVRSREFRERGIYRVDEVERLAYEHERLVASGQPVENHMMFLWQVLNLELWLRQVAQWRSDPRPVRPFTLVNHQTEIRS